MSLDSYLDGEHCPCSSSADTSPSTAYVTLAMLENKHGSSARWLGPINDQLGVRQVCRTSSSGNDGSDSPCIPCGPCSRGGTPSEASMFASTAVAEGSDVDDVPGLLGCQTCLLQESSSCFAPCVYVSPSELEMSPAACDTSAFNSSASSAFSDSSIDDENIVEMAACSLEDAPTPMESTPSPAQGRGSAQESPSQSRQHSRRKLPDRAPPRQAAARKPAAPKPAAKAQPGHEKKKAAESLPPSPNKAQHPNQPPIFPDRAAEDQYILDMRKKGYSYKKIHELGGFDKEVSSLRGRHRVLTRDKSERVRKPQWTAEDRELLPTIVRQVRRQHGGKKGLPWEKVAEAFRAHGGGSYPFSATACHKMWDTIRQNEGN
ncbi:hypothetical protein B0I35DRAFT_44732 [Stachybotrys elegans]|uniref:Myb-like domain-containing protein n=1 Tax=Stachybotrys elegans TaxID=80388 RepID=A0A8K0T3Z1_9HYPO|nr:hypothetical protein B0I35DRAFT_44732 [Stachybotrys elegans]